MKQLLIILILALAASTANAQQVYYVPGGGAYMRGPAGLYVPLVVPVVPYTQLPQLGRYAQRGNQLHHRHANEAAYQAAAARHHWHSQ